MSGSSWLSNMVNAWSEAIDHQSECELDRLCQAALEGRDDFAGLLQAQQERLESAADQLEQLLRQSPPDGATRDILGAAYELLLELEEALQDLWESRHEEQLEEAVGTVRYLAARLYERQLDLDNLADLVNCPACAAVNAPGQRLCRECEVALPGDGAGVQFGYPPELEGLRDEYTRLYDLCRRAPVEVRVCEALEAHLMTMRSRWRGAERRTADFSRSSPSASLAQRLNQDIVGALQGLDEMLLFCQDGEVVHLNRGWVQLLSGVRSLYLSGKAGLA